MAPFLHLKILWLLLSSNLLLLSSSLVSDGEGRMLSFPAFFFFADKRLMNHTVRTEQAPDADVCELLCYQEHICVSINFKGTSCELNNSTHREHDEDFVDSAGYVYHGTDNACGSSPCLNGATCQSGFTNKRHRCLCPVGWTGEHCEQDINECKDGVHNCSQSNLTCINTNGSFFCTDKPECYNFTSLTDADRKPSYILNRSNVKKDESLGPGWFRFQGDAGSMMTTSCVDQDRCNTAAPGWLNGTHPEVTDGIVSRKVCFSYKNNENKDPCCFRETEIQVRNCSDYIVYFLHSTPYKGKGSLRYCGSD